MREQRQKLLIRQLDTRFARFTFPSDFQRPTKGWIYTVRTTLKMSLRQLSTRLKKSLQSVREMELREESGSITIKGLKEAADALNMDLVYFFLPRNQSIEKMIEDRALELATQIVNRSAHTMKLEDQAISPERLQEAILERAEQIKNDMPRYLWD